MIPEPRTAEPEIVDQARHLLHDCLHGLEELAQQADPSSQEFFSAVLQRVGGLLSSAAGAVWLRQGDGGPLRLECQQGPDGIPQLTSPEARARHALALEKLAGGGATLIPPGAVANGDGHAANPTDYLLLVAPLRNRDELLGAIELFQHLNKPAAVQRGYLSLLEQVAEIARGYLAKRSQRQAEEGRKLWNKMQHLSRAAHASLRLAAAARA